MPTTAEWKTLLDDDPENELVRFSYAKALLDEKDWRLAATQFEQLVKDNPDYALAWAHLARCLLRAGDRNGARVACEKGLPVARRQRHEVPLDELNAVLEELDSEF